MRSLAAPLAIALGLATTAIAVQTWRLSGARAQAARLGRLEIARCNGVHAAIDFMQRADQDGRKRLTLDMYERYAADAIECSIDRQAARAAFASHDMVRVLELVPVRDADDVDAADRLTGDLGARPGP